MKTKEIRDLIDFIAETGLSEVNIETEELKISVKRNAEVQTQVMGTVAPVSVQAPAQVAAPQQPQAEVAPPSDKSNYVEVKSPMIGTFYKSANPESAPFVSVGDSVSAGQTVCIIEAMKLFNEIESEVSGTIVKILIDNATPVEYDQPLFLVDPS